MENQYQQAGFKGLERYDITIRVLECIDFMGDVFTSLRFRGITKESNSIYESFINSFYKIFQITASMMSKEDLELLAKIEESFQKNDISLTVENSGYFLYLFEEYLHALKKAGVYDPMVIKQFSNPYAKWQESV